MTVQILFFGATAETAGHRSKDVAVADGTPAKVLFDSLLVEYPQLTRHKLHFALNQEFATGDEKLRDGDEIAVFTAVSGG